MNEIESKLEPERLIKISEHNKFKEIIHKNIELKEYGDVEIGSETASLLNKMDE
jgi:hypothetical protein